MMLAKASFVGICSAGCPTNGSKAAIFWIFVIVNRPRRYKATFVDQWCTSLCNSHRIARSVFLELVCVSGDVDRRLTVIPIGRDLGFWQPDSD